MERLGFNAKMLLVAALANCLSAHNLYPGDTTEETAYGDAELIIQLIYNDTQRARALYTSADLPPVLMSTWEHLWRAQNTLAILNFTG